MSVVRLGKPREFEPVQWAIKAPCIGGCGDTMTLSLYAARVWFDWECKRCAAKGAA